MGHDYTLMMPNLLNGHIWFRNNGVTIPWFTPAFCAGQPFFADPQSFYYSLPQLITILAGPVIAVHWTLLLDATLMYWGGYLLMRRVFSTTPVFSVLVGGLLMFNGFLPYRMVVGHITFHGFALTPWIALLLLLPVRHSASSLIASILAGALLAYWVHSGFGSLALAGILAIILIAILSGLDGGDMVRFVVRATLAGLVGIGIAAEKLWATFSFMSNYPRDFYDLPGAASVIDAFLLIIGGLFLPSRWMFDIGNSRIVNSIWELHPHEWAYGFGMAPGLLIIALVTDRVRKKRWCDWQAPRQFILWIMLILCLLCPIALNVYNPEWHKFLKTLPLLKSSSVLFRWTIAYIPFTAIVIGLLLERSRWKQVGFLAYACLFTIAMQTILEPRQYYLVQHYDIRPITITDRQIRSGEFTPEIKELGISAAFMIDNNPVTLNINDPFLAGVSQIFCYNPTFGYALGKFSAAGLVSGSVFLERNGFLNLKNPACYVFPIENHCKPGDLFRADQIVQARNFVAYRAFDFQTSNNQQIARIVTRISFIASILAVLGWLLWQMRYIVVSLRSRLSQ